MSVPSGDTATHGKFGRSPAAVAFDGAENESPPLVDTATIARSLLRPFCPSAHPSTIAFDAPAPVGAPFATSIVGPSFVRAPATPSIVRRPWTGSSRPTVPVTATARGLSKLSPPSNERDSQTTSAPWNDPRQTTYTVPVLLDRTTQPCRPPERPAPTP